MELMIGDETICLRKRSYKRYYFLVGVLAALGGFLAGILIGRFAIPPSEDTPVEEPVFLGHQDQQTIQADSSSDLFPGFSDKISAENIKLYLKDITARPHLAGTPNSERLARQLEQFWKDLHLDDVRLTPYSVLLPFPNISHPNSVQFVNNDGKVIFTAKSGEVTLTPDDDVRQSVPPYHGYSPAGEVEAELVYANYGRFEDLNTFSSYLSINFTGKIILARYGKAFRGDIVKTAEQFGCVGVLIYSDPKDYTWGKSVYPNDWWLPGSGVQRGTVFTGTGDPLTPAYPSIKSAYRAAPDSAIPSFPKIPSQPISYDDARYLLSQLDGYEALEEWRGGLNVTYRHGGGGKPNGRVRLRVTNFNEKKTIYNVIGIIKGSVEPDRYVIIGNHRDAWGFGAHDPGSGSAILKELSRVYSQMVQEGWRPRRSLMFCSWGAEEHGLIGSTEWAEQFSKVLGSRAVAYLNIDTAVQGNYSLEGNASPLMYSVMYEATKRVPNPDCDERDNGLSTVYDKWLRVFPLQYKNRTLNCPELKNLGVGSDYATFYQRLGIASADVHYVYNKELMSNIAYHPLYHTTYDTFYAFQSFVDQTFQISKTMAHVWAETSLMLVDSVIIPFKVTDYAVALSRFVEETVESRGKMLEMTAGLHSSELTEAARYFEMEARNFQERIAGINQSNVVEVRMMNDQLLQLERAFLDPLGLPGRPLARHVLMSPSISNYYVGSSFAGLHDAIEMLFNSNPGQFEETKQQWSIAVFTILSAASTLRDSSNFMAPYYV